MPCCAPSGTTAFTAANRVTSEATTARATTPESGVGPSSTLRIGTGSCPLRRRSGADFGLALTEPVAKPVRCHNVEHLPRFGVVAFNVELRKRLLKSVGLELTVQ